MESFERIRDLQFFHHHPPITFAHRRFCDRDTNHRFHLNHHYELYVFVSGEAGYIVEDTYYHLQRGDLILIRPHQVHKAVLSGEGIYERFYLLFSEDAFAPMAEDPLTHLLLSAEGAPALISPPKEEKEVLLSLLYQMSSHVEQSSATHRTAALACLLELISRLPTYFSQREEPPPLPRDRLLSDILVYLDRNAAQIQSLSRVAAAVGVSVQYLSGYFSQKIGTTLSSYLRAKKIAIAKKLLDKGASVTEACYESGFNDCSYFIRVFRRYLGCTPLQYKQGK